MKVLHVGWDILSVTEHRRQVHLSVTHLHVDIIENGIQGFDVLRH